MKIRNKITVWITGAGLLASLIFSAVVFYELIEQPFDLLDAELAYKAQHTLLEGLHLPADTDTHPDKISIPFNRLYWIKVFDEHQKVLYASDMVRLTDLPLYHKNTGYTVHTSLLKKIVLPEPEEDGDEKDLDKAAFRVRVVSIPVADKNYVVQIARAMDNLDKEISELLLTLLLGLTGSTVVLIFVGYFAAGRILQPISDINKTAREISDKTLGKRIPLGKTHDELYELSVSLNTMFDRLQYSFEHQKEFIANASHELKTPVTLLRLLSEDSLQHEDLPDALKEKLTKQIKTLFRMDRLVKNLLDLSALELRKSFSPEFFDFAELVNTVFEEFTIIIEARDIELSVDIPEKLPIYGDSEKIRRALINIIDNSIKYNLKNDGKIIFKAVIEGKHCIIDLYNTGPGIPPEETERVFEQFYRVEKSRSVAHGGSGLGLAIVKQIIELHEGRIEMQSSVGSWARILITLPTSAR